ncbi:alpha-1,2-mannosyltransferase [Kribbella amoyensis]|uniref:Alpha-1,2-mannosyltransferase n=2 Tax=Kribbella amoyensis TaxID=996641 RepID=A0A561BJD1_9ACTN|nr:alpha-1,2-mannosyltransferase [Kribbella amoyensis]
MPGISALPTPARWWVLAAACLLVAALLPFLWWHTGADLKVYRLGGATVLDDPATLYTASPPHMSLPFTYPVFGAVVMIPAAALPWPIAYAVSIAISFGALLLIWRLCLGRIHPSILLTAAVLSLLLDPVRETLSFGQINLVLCALVLFDLLSVDRSRRGILIGIAAGIKLTPVVFFGLLLVTRQWRALATATVSFLGTVAIGFVVAPRTALDYWTRILPDSERIGALAYAGNQSWNGLLTRLTGDPAGGGPFWYGLVGVTIAAGLWATRLLWNQGERLAAVAVCSLIGLLCSPVSWNHHWVWVIPLGVALCRSFAGRARYLVAAAWFVVFALAPIWWPPRRDDRELGWSFLDHLAGDSYLWLAVGAAVTVVVAVRRRETRQLQPSAEAA